MISGGAVALALSLAACSGDDGASTTASTATTSTGGTGTGTSADPTGTEATSGATESGTTESGRTESGTTEVTTAGTGGLGPECVIDSDCQKVANCCVCSSIPADVEPGECEDDCLVDSCTAKGLEGLEAACRSGGCEFGSTIECSGPVSCDSLPPECISGEVPSIVDECWGPCVPYHYCADTSACTPSCGEGWVCVEFQSGAGGGCMPLSHECDGSAGCSCMAPYWGEVCESACSGDPGGLLCEDGG